jgi:hypothetical protein
MLSSMLLNRFCGLIVLPHSLLSVDTWASSGRLHPVQPTGNVKGVLQVEKDNILEGKIDSLMRLEKMEIEKKEA